MDASVRSRTIRALGVALTVLAAGGCVDPVVSVSNESSGGSASTTSASTTSASAATIEPDDDAHASATASSGTTSGGTTSSDSTGVAFVGPEIDCCGVSFECDQWAQDCPPGEKCMPWANDGGGGWNATRCSPLAEDPAAVGEPCHVEGSGTSGIDDCELGAVCWNVDSKTNEGVCEALCLGSENAPYCADPHATCHIASEGALTLCLSACNPLEQDCLPSQGCYPIVGSWSCAPDASGEQGAYGDPCEYINVCDSGLVCLDPSTVPPGLPCEGSAGCCTEVCDLADPLGDQQCMGVAEGQACQAWYEDGTAPAFLEDVGVCALPL